MYLYEQPRHVYDVKTTSMRRQNNVSWALIRLYTCKLFQWERFSNIKLVCFQYLNIMIVKVCNGSQHHPVLYNTVLNVCWFSLSNVNYIGLGCGCFLYLKYRSCISFG